MSAYEFHILDVFTDRVFGGNPLGVFPDARGLDPETMQRIARELNLSETVFLSSAESHMGTRRARIFTPATEVPFAGHPTVGAAWFLASHGAAGADGVVALEENVGLVRVDVDMADGRPIRARLTTAIPPEFRDMPWQRPELARLLSLEEDEIGAPGWEPEMVSCGLPFLIVPVRSLDAARRSRLDTAAWEDLTRGAWSRMVYVVTPEAEGEGVDVHVRMYAPAAGVPEDPATGSAAAALAGYLGKRAGGSGSHAWRIEQGIEMGRPSLLDAEVDVEDGRVVAVRVGGQAVTVSRGTMEVPGETAGWRDLDEAKAIVRDCAERYEEEGRGHEG